MIEEERWTRVYPEEGVLNCPFCYDSFWRARQRERHVRGQHGAIPQRWMCSVCSEHFPSKLSVANHFSKDHPTMDVPTEDRSNEEEDGEAFPCSFCERTLPSMKGLRNHERAYHQAAVSAGLTLESKTTATTTEKKSRNRWTDNEIRLFKEAVRKVGVNSNVAIAREVGTRTAKQCGNFKKRFLAKNPTWGNLADAPPLASQQSPKTPTSCSSMDTDSTPQSQGTTLSPRPLVMVDSPRSTPSPSIEEIWLRTVTPPPRENQRLIRAEEIVNRLRRAPDSTQEASETRTTPPHLKENRPHETEEGSPPCGQDWRRTTQEVMDPSPSPTEEVSTPIEGDRETVAEGTREATEKETQPPRSGRGGDTPTERRRGCVVPPTPATRGPLVKGDRERIAGESQEGTEVGIQLPPPKGEVATPTGQQSGCVATYNPEKKDSPLPSTEGDREETPSPSVSQQIQMRSSPMERTRPSEAVEKANRALRALRAPIQVGVEGTPPPLSGREEIIEPQATQERDVVELITNLLEEDPQSTRRQEEDSQGQEGRSTTKPSTGMGEDPDPVAPQQCSEHEPLLGWPYSPGSPCQVFTAPTGARMERGGGSPGELDTTPTRSQHTCRTGPDYALRDYIQGYRASRSQVMTWPYSPLPPNTPGPGSPGTPQPEQAKEGVAPLVGGKGRPSGPSKDTSKGRDPIHQGKAGDTNTMAPRNSGRGKGPEGKKDWRRKGAGDKGQARGGGDPRTGGPAREREGREGNGTNKRGGRDERVQVRCPNPPPRPHRRDEHTGSPREGARGRDTNTQPTDPAPTPPTLTITQHQHRTPEATNLGEIDVMPTTPGVRDSPTVLTGVDIPATRDGDTTRPHLAGVSPLLMNKEDNRAPLKLFAPLKPFTERVLSMAEWSRWCHDLQRWTLGLSKWAFDRSKADSPQQAWGRRQTQRRQRGNQEGQGPPPHTGRNRTITRMANLQRLYNSSPKECIDSIRHNPPPLRCEVPKEEVERYFREKLQPPEGINVEARPPFNLWLTVSPSDVMETPITQMEVKGILQSMDVGSAPGPDRIRYRTLKQIDQGMETVTSILNTCRVNGKVPPEWKQSSTILIHKGDDPLALDNWRPIALQNTLYKVYAAVIARRISCWAVDTGVMSQAQKGFLPMEGCLEHNHLITSVLQDSRKRKRPAFLTWLDLKDAYGSVPHEILLKTMKLAGLEGATLRIVEDLYHQPTTTVKTKHATTHPITIRRGVKQGCPLSPILFNIVMEVIIRAAEGTPAAGYRIANSTIKSLAYADDLCILASTSETMQAMLDRIHQASRWAGLTFSPRKCASLSVIRSQRSRQRIDNEVFKMGGVVIPTMAWADHYKYLGVKTGADHSTDLNKVGSEYTRDVQLITNSELTDWQKLDAIHRFAKPRLVYSLQNQIPPLGWAKTLDKKVRAMVKANMKLPRRTTDTFFYSPARAGGLGLPKIEDEVHIYGVSSAYRLLTLSKDPAVRDIAQQALWGTSKRRTGDRRTPEQFLNAPPEVGEGHKGDIKSRWSRVRVSLQRCQAHISLDHSTISIAGTVYGPNKKHLICRAMRAVIQEGHLTRWQNCRDQGRAVKCVSAHPASNHWIKDGKYTSFQEYRFAHKARLNVLPTRTVRKRSGEAIRDVSCQRCFLEQETLAHILNHCPPNVGLVRARHNNILHRLARAIPDTRGVKVLEQVVPGDTRGLKPDLVVLDRAKAEAFVVDVTVPFEGEESFTEARKAKEEKYAHLKQILRGMGYRKVEVDGFVVGALGSWDPGNDKVIQKLGIGYKYAIMFRKLCCTEAIKGSYGIWRAKTGER